MGVTAWLPGFEVIKGEGSGSWAGNVDAPKGVAHSTETGPGSINGVVNSYRANRSWPHVTADPFVKRKVQHVSLHEAARALRNTAAGGQTNKDGRTYQVEIVLRAGQAHLLTGDQLDWLGREVIRPMSLHTGTPLRTTVSFHPYPPENGIRLDGREPWRLTPAGFDAYSGWLGHQHVPENFHGDPGRIDIQRMLAAARDQWTPPPFPRFLRVGSRGQDVATLKVLLIGAGYTRDVNVTTPVAAQTFGVGTRRAVMRAQADLYRNAHEKGKPDGVVGPRTWGWLVDVIKVRKAGRR